MTAEWTRETSIESKRSTKAAHPGGILRNGAVMKKTSARGTSKKSAREGPFSAAVQRRAAELAARYSLVVSASDEGWSARCVEIPTAFAFAETEERALESARERVRVLLAFMIEQERKLPAPMRESKRDSQVNVKLTAEERMVIEEAARQQGFRGLSDFFRFAAMRVAQD